MSSTLFFEWREGGWWRLGTVLGLHLLGLAVLLHYTPASSALSAPAPIMVSLIQDPVVVVTPPVELPKPKIVHKDPPKKILVAETALPSPVNAVAPPPEPTPPAAPVAVAQPAPVVLPDLNAAYAENPIDYPRISKRLGEHGDVMLRVWINAKGLVDKVELVKTSGYPRLDNAALEQVPHWKFRPPTRAGQPTSAESLVPIKFYFVS